LKVFCAGPLESGVSDLFSRNNQNGSHREGACVYSRQRCAKGCRREPPGLTDPL
jgi:hypothetical protein